MTQLILNIEKPKLVPVIKKLLSFIDGVSIVPNTRRRHKKEENPDIPTSQLVEAPVNSAELLDTIAGAWSHNGHTSDEDIAIIYTTRQQNKTRLESPL